MQRASVVRMLSRSVLLAYHDVVVLLLLGLMGSLVTDDPRVVRVRPFIAVAMVVASVVGAFFWALPAKVRARFRAANAESFLEGWSIRRSLRLIVLGLVYFSIFVVYAVVALRICRLPVDHQVVLSTVPLVLLADGLPNIASLGTRETALQLLLAPDRPAVLFALSLFWSTGLIVGRLAIALAHVWGNQLVYGRIWDISTTNEPLDDRKG